MAGSILEKMDSGSDNCLMQLVRSGDIDKLGLLFERYKAPLFGYYYRTTRDVEISEDLVQSVFLRILKYRHRFSNEGKFSTWMYHIAHNVYKDYIKKSNSYQNSVDFSEKETVDFNTAEELVLKRENICLIEKALCLLSNDHREILVLSRYQGLKYKEIGEILGCSVGAVKVRVFRAITNLKRTYSELKG